MSGIFKRYIVTAYNLAGDAYRYMAETEEDAKRQVTDAQRDAARERFISRNFTPVGSSQTI